MSNLLTLTQDEIDRFELKGKIPGDTITAEEYSELQKEYKEKQNNAEEEDGAEEKRDKKPAKK